MFVRSEDSERSKHPVSTVIYLHFVNNLLLNFPDEDASTNTFGALEKIEFIISVNCWVPIYISYLYRNFVVELADKIFLQFLVEQNFTLLLHWAAKVLPEWISKLDPLLSAL